MGGGSEHGPIQRKVTTAVYD